jgi:hypothetical protein
LLYKECIKGGFEEKVKADDAADEDDKKLEWMRK